MVKGKKYIYKYIGQVKVQIIFVLLNSMNLP